MAEPRHPLLKRGWGRVLGIASVVLGLVLLGSSQFRMQYLLDRLDEEVALRVATQCVTSWDRVGDIRDGDEKTYRTIVSSLIELSSPSADELAAINRIIGRDVAAIRAQNPDPTCDLKASQALMRDARR